jgi:Inorganic pyrophosphatase
MTNYAKLPTWADGDHVYAVVETPRGSRAKLEFDPQLGAFTLAKPLLAGLTYPYDWGFIPSTKAASHLRISLCALSTPRCQYASLSIQRSRLRSKRSVCPYFDALEFENFLVNALDSSNVMILPSKTRG